MTYYNSCRRVPTLFQGETLEELHRAVASVKYAARRVPERQEFRGFDVSKEVQDLFFPQKL